ncbi:MAG TPA: class I SAM-dependent methyltransferase [Solirubrobacteraceae bacterium]|jgi:ubiquinone/menaquinone biosynthesis C-methylase UbiE|nr:class I SAM-dependent methyltransferase [Solirubrobacteraceae bacterium]
MSSGCARTEHPVFARLWVRIAGFVAPDWRRAQLLAGTSGRVLEIGCGDGRSFRHYPAAVREVVAIEPEPYLRGLADAAAGAAAVPVRVLAADAERLPMQDGSCDAVICSLVLCSVADQPTVLAEIRRVLRSGGELRFYEHVVAHRRSTARVQRRLDSSGVWPRVSGGCHLARDTLAAIAASGLVVEQCSRFPSGPGPGGVPIVRGIARRPPT